ncbi:hypothetical protein [Ruficoccus sp. ZRK36]|uniref:hypothetical protein n=1 Tax=Ruficoccus sp. ZRK36 TaxID=2866311 RepID=UPI001C72B8F3|nr:hypothetical protein [Ruficoccus sp. ZRK36]QYY36455.1 hypothetical protein K0V07_03045 [Ruficoccus sp. ZRK36]
MNIDDFISKVLVGIVSGVEKARTEANSPKSVFGPPTLRVDGALITRNSLEWEGQPVHVAEFDIAVTVREDESLSGGGGLCIAGITAGGGKKSERENSTVSRVKFEIPYVLPL